MECNTCCIAIAPFIQHQEQNDVRKHEKSRIKRETFINKLGKIEVVSQTNYQ